MSEMRNVQERIIALLPVWIAPPDRQLGRFHPNADEVERDAIQWRTVGKQLEGWAEGGAGVAGLSCAWQRVHMHCAQACYCLVQAVEATYEAGGFVMLRALAAGHHTVTTVTIDEAWVTRAERHIARAEQFAQLDPFILVRDEGVRENSNG